MLGRRGRGENEKVRVPAAMSSVANMLRPLRGDGRRSMYSSMSMGANHGY